MGNEKENSVKQYIQQFWIETTLKVSLGFPVRLPLLAITLFLLLLSSFQGLGEMTSPKQQPFLQSLVYMWKLLKNLLPLSLTHLIDNIKNYLYLVFVLSFWLCLILQGSSLFFWSFAFSMRCPKHMDHLGSDRDDSFLLYGAKCIGFPRWC